MTTCRESFNLRWTFIPTNHSHLQTILCLNEIDSMETQGLENLENLHFVRAVWAKEGLVRYRAAAAAWGQSLQRNKAGKKRLWAWITTSFLSSASSGYHPSFESLVVF
jgi:hypothetical protein